MTRALTPFTLLLIALLPLAGCGADDPDDPSSAAVRTVHTEPVRALQDATARSFSGTLRAPLETNLSFRIPGHVAAMAVDVGSTVQAGDVIARLDAEDVRLEVDAAQASYRQARATAENARARFQRIKTLYASDNASLSAYDDAQAAYETARNRATAARRQLDLSQKRLGYTRLTAPASGTIADTYVESGENVAVGQPVARLTSGSRLEVKVQVPEALVTDLSVGQAATVSASVLQEDAVPATVTEVATAPGGRRPTYPVVVTLDESAPQLRSGMTARVAFDVGTASGWLVPSTAVHEDESGTFVYVVAADTSTVPSTADGRATRRSVQPGALTPDGLIVSSGLRAGDRVVTAGVSQIRDGDPVRISRLLSSRP